MQTTPLRSVLAPALGLAALAASALPSFAQPADGAGLLGKRYAEAFSTLFDYQNVEDNGYAVGATVNVPVAARIDVGATFEHNWTEGDRDDNFQDLSAYVTIHTEFGAIRPFATAELGYEWWSVSDDYYYKLKLGAEYSVSSRVSVSGSVNWGEFLAQDWNGGNFSASVRLNYWLTDTLAASLTGNAVEGGTWGYGVAVVATF